MTGMDEMPDGRPLTLGGWPGKGVSAGDEGKLLWVFSGGGGSSAGLRLRWCSVPGCLWLGCFRWQGEGARGCWQGGAVICSITMLLLGPGGNNPAYCWPGCCWETQWDEV